jgi:hypothetical protein
MFIALFLRNGKIHIVSYRQRDGNYRAVCNKTIKPVDRINTIAFDNTFPGICEYCKSAYDEMYRSDLEDDTVMAHNSSTNNYVTLRDLHLVDFMGPKNDYETLLEDKTWYKLAKYQRLVKRTKKHV